MALADDPPLVSVVIPAFDRVAFVGEAVQSVLDQTWPYVEAIVVDDGSTDGTAAALHARFGSDGRVQVVRQANAGPSAARNRGAAAARGAFIGFLDSDDRYLPTCLESQLRVMDTNPDAGFLIADVRYVGEWPHDAARLFAHPDWCPPTTLERVLAGGWASICGWLLRADTARAFPFDEAFRSAEDTELLARYLAAGHTLAVSDAVVAEYVGHDGSRGAGQLSAAGAPIALMLYELGERYHDRIPHAARGDLSTRRRLAVHLADQGRWREARPHIVYWWSRRFWRRAAWRYLLRSLRPGGLARPIRERG